MGCSCSTSSDEWSDSDSDSSLSELPPYIRRSTKTVELRKHTVTQHACLDKEVKGDGSGTCEETLESHPRVALPRLGTIGEENNIDGSKPSKPVHSTLDGPPSIAIMMTEASGDQQRPMVDPEPQRGDKDDTDDLEKAPNQCAIDEPGPSTVRQNGLLPTPNPEPDTGLLPPPPPEPDTSLMPPPTPEPDTSLMPPPTPEPDTSLMPPPPPELSVSSEVNVRLATVSSPHIDQQTGRGATKSEIDWQDNAALKRPWLPVNSRVSKSPSRDEGDVRLTTMSSPMSFHHTDVTTSSVKFDDPGKLYHQETRRRSNKSEFDWQDNAALKRPWLPANSRIWKIRSREEGDGPSVLICFYNAPEDLGTPRPERHHVGTQTLPPGACGDASIPSCKIHSVCPEQRVMAEGGDSGDKPKATVWSQRTPQAEFPQKGSRGDFPGPVLEPRPPKNIQPMLNRSAEKSSTTKADDQPAHPPAQQVGSKLTYAQVLRMPPRKRAPPPDLTPPYPQQEPQSAETPYPIKLRYAWF
ncbi:ras-associated and pleckstrin homology domains-containing protein 1-like isoform X2 [Takifugu rubripes]|uniref:ras-associated and pleckstrin homology domains-containing protein 1-like isoform X2 n=1 Tax=Takifugu rubripes TaxID=31033 RepID=UPI001145E31E|nr:ras-associated and pleckstrin homology domains-containing protein 1-like isoform X2 [Takifugu rubripes]